MFSLTVQDLEHLLQTNGGVWLDSGLDLKEHKQVTLQKSFKVPLVSTAAVMRS